MTTSPGELAELPCKTCPHRREPHIPEPSCISDATNRHQLRWFKEWRNRLQEREMKEHGIAADRDPFPDEPWYFAWCHVKSLRESKAGNDEDIRAYILADEYQMERKKGRSGDTKVVFLDCEDHPTTKLKRTWQKEADDG
jgi:hypothetical protein